jgi:Polycystin cation channel
MTYTNPKPYFSFASSRYPGPSAAATSVIDSAVLRIQRAFRKRYYRFDRRSLINRIRLESKLETLGGRLFWITLLLMLIYYSLSIGRSDINKYLYITQIFNTQSVTDSIQYMADYNSYISTSIVTTSNQLLVESDSPMILLSLPVISQQKTGGAGGSLCGSSLSQSVLAAARSVLSPSSVSSPCDVSSSYSGKVVSYVGDIAVDEFTESFEIRSVFYGEDSTYLFKIIVESIKKIPSITVLSYDRSKSTTVIVLASLSLVISSVWLMKDSLKFGKLLIGRFGGNRGNGVDSKYDIIGHLFKNRFLHGVWLFINWSVMVSVCALSIAQIAIEKSSFVGYDTLNVISSSSSGASNVYNAMLYLESELLSKDNWFNLGYILLFLLLSMLIYCMAGHPRIGMFTATWLFALDDLVHFMSAFVLFFFGLSVIGYLGFNDKYDPFRSLGRTIDFQFEILWSGDWSGYFSNPYGDGLLMFYLIALSLVLKIVLFNFFQAILIEAYMAVRESVNNIKVTESFMRDSLNTLLMRVKILEKFVPERFKLLLAVNPMYARRSVGIRELEKATVFREENMKHGKPDLLETVRMLKKYKFLAPANITEDIDEKDKLRLTLDVMEQKRKERTEMLQSGSDDLQVKIKEIQGLVKIIRKN